MRKKVPKLPSRITPGTKGAKIVKFVQENPGLTHSEIARRLNLGLDNVGAVIRKAKKQGYLLNVLLERQRKEFAEPDKKVVHALRNTLLSSKEIAKKLGLQVNTVNGINKRHKFRSPLISHVIGGGHTLHWERLPKKSIFNKTGKTVLIQKYMVEIGGIIKNTPASSIKKIPKTRNPKGLNPGGRVKQEFLKTAFDALDHYSSELCGERLFLLLVAQGVVRKNSIKEQPKKTQ